MSRAGAVPAADSAAETNKQDEREPEEFWIYTRWASLEAYEAYRKGPEFRKAHARLASIPGIVKIDKASHSVTKFHVIAR